MHFLSHNCMFATFGDYSAASTSTATVCQEITAGQLRSRLLVQDCLQVRCPSCHPTHSCLQARCPSCHPTYSVSALKQCGLCKCVINCYDGLACMLALYWNLHHCLLVRPPSVWPHLFCGAGHEKRRGEQLKWSLACRLYIRSFVFHVHIYQDQFIQLGWADCVLYLA